MTKPAVTDSFRSLEAEVKQLREHVQIQARHNEVIEAQLAKLLHKSSGASEIVDIRDEICPLFDSVNLTSEIDGEKPYQRVDPAFLRGSTPTDNEWWPTNRKVSNYLVPNSGWQNHSIQGKTSLVIGFSMFGLERKKIEEYVELVRHQQSVGGNFVPVFLTDCTCFDVFRRYGFVFEYFPSPEKRMTYAGSMDWGSYAEKRLDLLIRKWGIAKMIVFGERTIMTDAPIDLIADGKDLSLAKCAKQRSRTTADASRTVANGSGSAALQHATDTASTEIGERCDVQQTSSGPCSDGRSGRADCGQEDLVEASRSVHDVTTSTRTHLVFFPDYRQANPYQTLLYGSLQNRFTIEAGSIHDALRRQAASDLDTSTIFHLHWEDAVIKNEPSEAGAKAAAKKFIEALKLFRSRGGAVVWTVHNVASHDGLYLDVQEALCHDLASIADRVHFHSDAAYQVASTHFDPPSDRVRIVQHGNYIDLIDSTEARDTVRKSLGYRPEDCVFILFGRIMRYKGAEDLLRAFCSLNNTNAKLIIAGKILDSLSIEGLPAECRGRISIHEGRLKQTDLSRLVRAADFSVLPYRRVLTSGSVLFSMSAGVPVIVPNLPTLREIVEPNRGGLMFEPGSWKDLAVRLREAASMNEKEWRTLASRALEEARRCDWSRLGANYSNLLLQCADEARSQLSPAIDRPDREPHTSRGISWNSRAA